MYLPRLRLWCDIDIFLPRHASYDFRFLVSENADDWSVIKKLKESLSVKQVVNLKEICLDKPKLRTFVKIKDFQSIPSYICKPK